MADANSTDEAINTVLRAERDAKKSVSECRKKADEWVAESRQSARRIAERTDSRISRLHARCAAEANRQVERMLQEEGEPEEWLSPSTEREVLKAAVDLLAAELIGENEESG